MESVIRKYGSRDVCWSSQGMLRLGTDAMRRLFQPTLERIKQAIGDVLNHPNARGMRSPTPHRCCLAAALRTPENVPRSVGADVRGAMEPMVATAPGEKLVIGRRQARRWPGGSRGPDPPQPRPGRLVRFV